MQHVMNRLDARGHSPIAEWGDADARSQVKAERVFREHIARHYTMYDLTPGRGPAGDENLGRKIEAFDPTATEILAAPQLVAG